MIDQIGRHINVQKTPTRIVSLVPSQTELLCDLGLEAQLVGITKFCVHPSHLKSNVTIVGGTKDVKYSKIKALQPDIILCNKEENTKEIVENLEQLATVHVSDIYNMQDALALIDQYGKLFSVEKKAANLISDISSAYHSFQSYMRDKPNRKVAYFIWRKPWMVAGGNTFINFLLKENKFENIFESIGRYPEVKFPELNALKI
ncbi:helical backbone metal receptor [Galbibacter sp. BG1]|uniref:ABC transporter substrate-binding protein n=1 Tax=Galbibacter sp. BG1 TaxID=1170699 RepID=UPI00293BB076|nr:helical backbone metal receptor [Galbibacter sp. BG1]